MKGLLFESIPNELIIPIESLHWVLLTNVVKIGSIKLKNAYNKVSYISIAFMTL